MPWRCPACELPIRHGEFEDRPRAATVYRCHICRLELVFDARADRLRVAPMRADEPERKIRSSG